MKKNSRRGLDLSMGRHGKKHAKKSAKAARKGGRRARRY